MHKRLKEWRQSIQPVPVVPQPKKKKEKKPKEIKPIVYKGLWDTICEAPVAFCRSKQLYLSTEDIERKQCTCKLSPDMRDRRRCFNLIMMDVASL